MNYKEIAERLESNLFYGNRYMGNNIYKCIYELTISNIDEIRSHSEENLEQLKKLQEPFHLNTGNIVDYYSLEKLTEISQHTIQLLSNYY